MTEKQAKQLQIGDRVTWEGDTEDMGTVVGKVDNAVGIRWDDTTEVKWIHFHDMKKIYYYSTPVRMHVL